MNLLETNSNRQSIKYYIKEKVPLYLVIQSNTYLRKEGK